MSAQPPLQPPPLGVLRLSFLLRGRRSQRAAALPAEALATLLRPWLAPHTRLHDLVRLTSATGPRLYLACDSQAAAAAAAAALHNQPCAPLEGLRVGAEALGAPAAAALLAGRAGAAAAPLLSPDAAAAAEAAFPDLCPADLAAPAAAPLPDCASRALPGIPGLLLVHGWVSAEEEARLASALDASAGWSSQLSSRRVLHFGYTFDYVSRSAVAAGAGAALGLAQRPLPMPVEGGEEGSALAGAFAAVAALGLIGTPPGAGACAGVALAEPLQGAAGLAALLAALPAPPVAAAAGAPPAGLKQATVNDYPPGRGISAHVDNHAAFLDGLASLTLLSGTVMEFSAGGVAHLVYLPPRSLLVLTGEARYAWRHGIAERRTDRVDGRVQARGRRVSITMRGVRLGAHGPCRCPWRSQCSDQDGGAAEPAQLRSPLLLAQKRAAEALPQALPQAQAQALPQALPQPQPLPQPPLPLPAASSAVLAPPPPLPLPTTTPQLEADHVHALYEAIAPHFSATRHSPWPRVAAYLRALPRGALLLDAGCGNGKYLAVAAAAGLAGVGYDRCGGLVEICVARGLEAVVGDALALPVAGGRADAVLSIAVLHHISTRPRRVLAVRELLRALRPGGGQLLCYAWAREQGGDSRRSFEGPDVLVPWCLKRHYVSGAAEAAPALPPGALLDEERGLVVLQRFCHVYVAGELEGLRASATDDITSALVAHARRVVLAEEAPGAGAAQQQQQQQQQPRFQVLLSWWESDNWCVLIERL